MKFLMATMAFVIMSTTALAQECATIQSHRKYTLSQKIFTFGTDFRIYHEKDQVGTIIQKIWRWGKTFELRNEKKELVAKAKQRVFSFGVKIDIYDCNDNVIGAFQENIFRSMFSVRSIYSILDANQKLVGQSKKLDFFGTDITFYDAEGEIMAELTRPYINWWGDKWSLVLQSDNKLDPRVMFFAAAYKTSADAERRAEEERRRQEEEESESRRTEPETTLQ